MRNLAGKVALVTGSAVGIGRAIATRLAQDGADLALFDIDEEGAQATAALVREAGRSCEVVRTDVSDYAQVRAAVDHVARTFGGIDIAVHNAGITRVGTVVDTPVEEFHSVLRINLDGVFFGCKAVVANVGPDQSRITRSTRRHSPSSMRNRSS